MNPNSWVYWFEACSRLNYRPSRRCDWRVSVGMVTRWQNPVFCLFVDLFVCKWCQEKLLNAEMFMSWFDRFVFDLFRAVVGVCNKADYVSTCHGYMLRSICTFHSSVEEAWVDEYSNKQISPYWNLIWDPNSFQFPNSFVMFSVNNFPNKSNFQVRHMSN